MYKNIFKDKKIDIDRLEEFIDKNQATIVKRSLKLSKKRER